MKKPILALVPSAYKTQKVYSVLPVNGDGDFTFSRTGDGTRVKENGLIETITGSNNPRLNWDGNCPSLLCEPTKTNYAINSSDASLWANVGGSQSITKTQNFSVSPTGEENATRLEAKATGNNYSLIQLSTSSITGNYTGSVYLKSNTQNTQNIIVYGRNTAVNSYEVGNEWRRIDLQGSGTTGQNLFLFIGSFPSNGSDEIIDISVWGGQIEAGLSATSYINTPSNQAVTRNKEHSIISELTGQTQFNHKEGVIVIDVEPYILDPTVSQSLVSQIKLQGAIYNQVAFEFKANNLLEFYINNAPSTPIIEYNYTHSGGRIKAAIKWNNGNYYIYVNGQILFAPHPINRDFTILEELKFEFNTNSKEFKGKVYGIQVFDEALDDAEIKKLTEL